MRFNNNDDISYIRQEITSSLENETLEIYFGNVQNVKKRNEIIKFIVESLDNHDIFGGLSPKLYRLNISFSNLNVSEIQTIAEALKKNNYLREFRLCCNNGIGVNNNGDPQIGNIIAESIADSLEENNNSVEFLYLSENHIRSNGAQAIARVLKNKNFLKNLDLNGNQIEYTGAEAIADALEFNQSLQYLNLSNNKIGVQGAEAIANALMKNVHLQKLELATNEIGDTGAQAIAHALKVNNSLFYLDLLGNKIGYKGAKEIANALKTNKKNSYLKTLNLNSNEIRDAGAEEIAIALNANIPLRQLYLQNNQIENIGAEAIADALKENNFLEYLDLGSFSNGNVEQTRLVNKIGDEGAEAIADALKTNTSLQYINLEANLIGKVGIDAIADSLKTNYTILSIIPFLLEDSFQHYLKRNRMKDDKIKHSILEKTSQFDQLIPENTDNEDISNFLSKSIYAALFRMKLSGEIKSENDEENSPVKIFPQRSLLFPSFLKK